MVEKLKRTIKPSMEEAWRGIQGNAAYELLKWVLGTLVVSVVVIVRNLVKGEYVSQGDGCPLPSVYVSGDD